MMTQIRTFAGARIDAGVDLEIGTHVRHRRYPELLGVIREVVRLKSGHESVLPYRVEWRDRASANARFDPKYADRMCADELEVVD